MYSPRCHGICSCSLGARSWLLWRHSSSSLAVLCLSRKLHCTDSKFWEVRHITCLRDVMMLTRLLDINDSIDIFSNSTSCLGQIKEVVPRYQSLALCKVEQSLKTWENVSTCLSFLEFQQYLPISLRIVLSVAFHDPYSFKTCSLFYWSFGIACSDSLQVAVWVHLNMTLF